MYLHEIRLQQGFTGLNVMRVNQACSASPNLIQVAQDGGCLLCRMGPVCVESQMTVTRVVQRLACSQHACAMHHRCNGSAAHAHACRPNSCHMS